jgi:hypothetical protein
MNRCPTGLRLIPSVFLLLAGVGNAPAGLQLPAAALLPATMEIPGIQLQKAGPARSSPSVPSTFRTDLDRPPIG